MIPKQFGSKSPSTDVFRSKGFVKFQKLSFKVIEIDPKDLPEISAFNLPFFPFRCRHTSGPSFLLFPHTLPLSYAHISERWSSSGPDPIHVQVKREVHF